MPEIRVFLFGYPRVECDGVAVAVPRRKALALLAYLGVTQSHHSRDVLASLLWPEEETAKGYAFLRNALWVLHQTPVDPWILATRHMVGLRSDAALWVDVAEFRRLIRTCERHKHPTSELCKDGLAALQAAAELARGSFLAGFVAEDSRSFEEWQFAEADILAQELAQDLEQLSDHFERAGDGASALRYAQRLLSARTLDEPAYRRVMRLQARSGDRTAALRTFDECVRILDHELSLRPGDETLSLAEEIRSRTATHAERRPAPRAGLPTFRLPIVGREEDLGRILTLFTEDDCRLITVTGAGGSGKTRLAVEVAERAEQFSEGSVFVSLVDIESPALVPAAILTTLGEIAESREPAPDLEADGPFRVAARRLANRDLLIVLDNVEQLSRDPRWLAALVQDASGPRFLATSRQELGVPGEIVYPIEGLPFPSSEAPTATLFAAVQLFLQAARRANGRFSPSPEDTSAIAAITRHLGGNPLAIELAASWVRTMPCTAIEAEILKSVDFLKTDLKLIPRRHRSLRAAFEGSWSLLDRDGRAAFRALSVFRGGFTPDDALRVAAVPLPHLARLVGKSLLARSETGRYEMLEVVRQYATERLRAVPEDAEAMLDRHAEHYLALLVSQESRLKGAEQVRATVHIALDEANLAAAWRHAAARRMTKQLARAAMGLFLFCDMTSRYVVGRELFHLAADAETGKTADAARRRAYLRGLEAWFTQFGDPRAAKPMFDEVLAQSATLHLDRDLAFVAILAAFSQRRLDVKLRSQAKDALTFFEEHGHAWELGAACEALTIDKTSRPAALALARRSLAIREEIGDPWGVALARYTEALILERMDDLDGAVRGFTESANLRRELGLDTAGLSTCYIRLGELKAKMGHEAEARHNLEEGARIAAQAGYRLAAARAHALLAKLEAGARRMTSARRHAKSAADAYTAAGYPDLAAETGQLLQPSDRREEPDRE